MCLWRHFLTSYNRQVEWTYRNKYMQNKHLCFFSTTEDKKVKLFCYFVIIYWCAIKESMDIKLSFMGILWQVNENQDIIKQCCYQKMESCNGVYVPPGRQYGNRLFVWNW